MRIPVGAGLVLVAAVTLAACASATGGRVPPASQSHASPGAPQSAAAIPGPPAGSRAEAAAQARLMLSRLRLPPGARILPPVPRPPSLAEPVSPSGGGATSLDQYRLFALRQSADASATFFADRAPAGMAYSGTGQGSGPGAERFTEVSYLAQPVPAGIYEAQLVLTMAPAGSGRSLMRADAQVTWYPPRTAAEYIDPARYHVLSMTITVSGARPHTVHAVVTSQAFITRLATALDQSQAEPDITLACPADFADYQLAFSVSRHSRPVVVVWSTQNGCGGSRVTVDGQQQPSLADDGTVAALVDQVVSVHWQL
jgi:hypothetical protein